MVNVPPPPQVVSLGGAVRFAVGDPAGLRSHTWSVVGNKTTDDIYLGLRVRMHDVKLTLHPRKWRMAFTEQAAARLLPPDMDRVLHRWDLPVELAPGWRQGATVAVPFSSLQPGLAETRPKKGAVAFFPAPAPQWALRFDVLVGAAERGELTVSGVHGEVGRLSLASGAVVWVVATEVPVDPTYEDGLEEVRREAQRHGGLGGMERPTGWAWGDGENGAPVLFDLGVIKG
jgi:hypothetical protein